LFDDELLVWNVQRAVNTDEIL